MGEPICKNCVNTGIGIFNSICTCRYGINKLNIGKGCFVVKFADGEYLTYSYGKGNWQEAYKLETIEQAQALVDMNLRNKNQFINDQTGYIKGIKPEYFDCNVVKWIVVESEV